MTISNYDDIIDSRDIIERIEELESERESLLDEVEEAKQCVAHHHDGIIDLDGDETEHEELYRCIEEWNNWDKEEGQELQALKALQEEAENYAPDWQHGATLIRESYFTEYAQELCEDIGSIPADCPNYIRNNIDWDGVANDLRVDYTEVEYDGVTYLVR